MTELESVAKLFKCSIKYVDYFECDDNFNHNLVAGYICRKRGLMNGSILITHVDKKPTTPQLIYGTPTVASPYIPKTNDYLPFKDSLYYLGPKWSGVNVLFFMYANADGIRFMGVKPKDAPFLEGRNFLLAKEAFSDIKIQYRICNILGEHGISAASFELCGYEIAGRVQYDFDIDLKPLFSIDNNGNIKPIVETSNYINHVWYAPSATIIADCQQRQASDHAANIFYQSNTNLNITREKLDNEGHILYLLNNAGLVRNRLLFKISPRPSRITQ